MKPYQGEPRNSIIQDAKWEDPEQQNPIHAVPIHSCFISNTCWRIFLDELMDVRIWEKWV